MSEKKKKGRFLIPLVITAAAIFIAFMLVILRKAPPRAQQARQAVPVNVITVYPDTQQLTLRVYGTVKPAREVTILPQVGGKIIWVSPDFVPGGIVRANDRIVVIDSSEYVVAFREARASLQQARAQYEQELGQQEIARREWELFSDRLDTTADTSLALRKPQLQTARAAINAAEARVQRARLNLDRTRIEAPFNGFVRNEDADVGQLVDPQSSIGVIIGTDRYWVQVTVPEEDIPYVSIPGINADTGSAVMIRHVVDGKEIIRKGRVEKLFGDLEPQGRMAQVLVVIENPTGIRDVADTIQTFQPLLVDAFVEVYIRGPHRGGLYALPREALRDNENVFLFGTDSTLLVVKPTIFWRAPDTIYIDQGLNPGDNVITSTIATPIEGMDLRLLQSLNDTLQADLEQREGL
ncbi:MAG: efflux RND transporter periplasmic adaptor subunit [Chitinivibrionales bacterium]|nr:efflux RND transporter periplasmic adaptor subunit [Chitinivibrionales bacterium]